MQWPTFSLAWCGVFRYEVGVEVGCSSWEKMLFVESGEGPSNTSPPGLESWIANGSWVSQKRAWACSDWGKAQDDFWAMQA